MSNKNAHIMIVDDSLTTRKVIARYLADAGYTNISEAIDGEQAWTKINAANPQYDLIIADWHMPVLTGLQLLQKIRTSTKFKSLPVVMATAERKEEEIAKIKSLGVTEYLIKPYEAPVLVSAVEKALH